MIDFSKYTLQELQAISDALDTLTDDIVERDLSVGWVFREYRNAREAVEKKIAQHVREAEKKSAGDPPELTVLVIPRKPIKIEPQDLKKFEDLYNEPAGDPPAAPDMFGCVGDALDDLCAAGEATGND